MKIRSPSSRAPCANDESPSTQIINYMLDKQLNKEALADKEGI